MTSHPLPLGLARTRAGRARHRRFPVIPMLAIAVLSLLVLMAVLAPWLAPYGPNQASFSDALKPPVGTGSGSSSHLLGTDQFGRDILSRLMYGAQYSLLVAVVTIAIGATVGTVVAISAGYLGGVVDAVLMRITDMMLSLPLILIALVLVTITSPSFTNVVLILALFQWAQIARQLRGEVLVVREQPYVLLARVANRSDAMIMVRHVLPNVVNTLLVMITLQVGWVILLESSLSFLGVGLPPPTPAWGLMVADGRELLLSAWWVWAFPGLAISLTVVAVNLLGDWLRDVLDPRTKTT